MKNLEYFIVIFLFILSAVPFYRIRKKAQAMKTASMRCSNCQKSKITDIRTTFFGFLEVHCATCRKYHKLPLANSIRLVYLVWLSLFAYSFFLRFNIVTLLLMVLILNVFIGDLLAVLKNRAGKR